MERLKQGTHRLLRWSEKYTRTDMVYLAKGGFWISTSRFIEALLGLVLSVALANLIPKEVLGQYKFVLSIASVIGAFALTGIGTAVTTAVAKGFEGIYQDGFKASMRWSVITVLVSAGTALYYIFNGNNELALLIAISGVCAPFIQSGQMYYSFFAGKKDFKRQTIFGVIQSLVTTLIILGAVFSSKSTILLVLAYYLGNAVVIMILYVTAKKKYVAKSESHPESLTYGKHLSLMNVLGTISFQLDRLLVFHYIGAGALAAYSIGQSAPQQLRYGSKVLSQLALPKFSEQKFDHIKKSLHGKALRLFALCVVITGVYWFAAPYVYGIFFPAYPEAVLYSQIYALLILFFPSMLYQQALTGQMRQRELYVVQVATPLVKIILLFALLPHYGIWGAFISIFAMEISRLGIVLYFFEKWKNDATSFDPVSPSPAVDNASDAAQTVQ